MEMKLLAVFLVVAVFVDSGSCLKCYICGSKSDSDCADPSASTSSIKPQECSSELLTSASKELSKNFPNSFAANMFNTDVLTNNMPNVPMACQKIVITVNGEKVIVRSCQLDKNDKVDPCLIAKNKMVSETSGSMKVNFEDCSLCKRDGCNASGTIHTSILLIALSTILGTYRSVMA